MDEQTKDFLKLGRDAYRKKEYSRAEDYLTRVAEQHDDFADVFNMLGVIYHDRGLFTKAQQNFERALAINPRYTEAALNLAVTWIPSCAGRSPICMPRSATYTRPPVSTSGRPASTRRPWPWGRDSSTSG